MVHAFEKMENGVIHHVKQHILRASFSVVELFGCFKIRFEEVSDWPRKQTLQA
jgi:uncharacterized linocin/CFP29 family protein